MANPFQTVQMRKPSANTFKLDHDVKYSMQMGTLTPILVQEVLPGDVFKIRSETLIRFAPLVAPVMHNITCFTHYFFVPNRIVWPNWESFISPDLSKEAPPAWPFLHNSRGSTLVRKNTLWDYFGLSVGKSADTGNFPPVSAIPFAAYQLIYKEYYRDQNLQPFADSNVILANGNNNSKATDLLTLRRRGWMHDYFTSALPFAQKGPAVAIPTLGGDLPVYMQSTGAQLFESFTVTANTGGSLTANIGKKNLPLNVPNYLYADASATTSATVNDLRVALRLQEWFEKAAIGGSRYVEQLMVHWNVKSSDARLDRPEFLGGTRNPVIISEVLQTSSSDTTTPQANMAGHAISANSGKSIRYRAEEHGYIIGIQSIMPNTAYQQGIPRHFSRTSWEDYAWPTFAHLGEQPILNQELYVNEVAAENEATFGYIPRYSEYRFTPSRVAGEFRDSLAFWHLGRIFTARPNLNAAFIESNPDNRIFAVTRPDNQNLWCHSFNKVRVYRKLPKYGTPTL